MVAAWNTGGACGWVACRPRSRGVSRGLRRRAPEVGAVGRVLRQEVLRQEGREEVRLSRAASPLLERSRRVYLERGDRFRAIIHVHHTYSTQS